MKQIRRMRTMTRQLTELEEQLDSMKQDTREGVDALTEAMAELASGSGGLVGDGLSRGSEFAGTDAHGIHRASSPPRAVRKSIEPAICDGAWCLFRTPVQGTREGKVVFVPLRDASDPETGQRYTVRPLQERKGEGGATPGAT